MKIISFIEDEEVIKNILKHLGLWDLMVRPPPKVKVSSVIISIDYSDSQVPFSVLSFYPDPDSSMDSHRISKSHRVTPMVTISAIYALFSDPQKSYDMIFIF